MSSQQDQTTTQSSAPQEDAAQQPGVHEALVQFKVPSATALRCDYLLSNGFRCHQMWRDDEWTSTFMFADHQYRDHPLGGYRNPAEDLVCKVCEAQGGEFHFKSFAYLTQNHMPRHHGIWYCPKCHQGTIGREAFLAHRAGMGH